MDFEWSERRSRVDRKTVVDFALARGITLPEAYIDMVVDHDGASIEDLTDFDVVDPEKGADVRGFGTLLSYDPSFGVDSVHDGLPMSAPAGIFPITIDGMGEYVALDCRRNTGQAAVVIWQGPHDPGEDGIIPVSDSFDGFLRMLRAPLD